jgi:sugar lactone lactonase YvrE
VGAVTALRALAIAGSVAAWLATPLAARAELILPPGFAVRVYVTGERFDSGIGRGVSGIPGTSTLAFDRTGALYLARTGRRYLGGEVDDLGPIYRIPVGGARLTPDSEARFFHGPPLQSPLVGTIRGGRELFVTTFDRERKLGVLYRLVDSRATLVAGGTPPRGASPLLRQPEGVAVDSAGRIYVADRAGGAVLRLDPDGAVLDAQYLSVLRPRILATDDQDALWVAADGQAEAPWQNGPGEIWRVGADGRAQVLLRGPMTAGMGLSPGGHLFVADRQGGQVFVLTADGRRVDFARFSDGDAPRSLAFAPVTPDTQRAGLAGDLFLVAIRRGAWPVNEILRISGPFDDLVRERLAGHP